MAFEITPDKDHKFELALTLNKIEDAFRIAEEQESLDKWKKVGDIALMVGGFELAEKCFLKSQDYNSLLLFYSTYGDAEGLEKVVDEAEKAGKYNVAYEAAYLLGNPDRCVDILIKSNRVSEAAFFARAYAPSKLPQVMKLWEESLQTKKLPFQPEDLMRLEGHKEVMEEALSLEQTLRQKYYSQPKQPAHEYEALKEEYFNDNLAD